MTKLTIHPLCDLFPPMTSDEFALLKESIKKNGVREPIVVIGNQIVDGRHRWKACQDLDVECPQEEWSGVGSLTDFVVDRNLHRRSLTASQRAMIANEALPFYEAEAKARQVRKPGDTAPNSVMANLPQQELGESTARDKAAKAAGVSGRSVQDAKKVAEEAPELAQAVKRGEITVSAAAKKIKQEKQAKDAPEQDAPVDALGRPIKDEKVAEAFVGKKTGESLMLAISRLKGDIADYAESHAGSYLQGPHIKDIASALDQIRHRVKSYLPHTACPRMPNCKHGCKLCKGRRFITAEMHKHLPSEEK